LLVLLCGGLFLLGAHLSNRRVLIGMGVGLGAATVGLHLAGLGMTAIIPGGTAAILLFMSLAGDKVKPA
jgi:hypothetical protein